MNEYCGLKHKALTSGGRLTDQRKIVDHCELLTKKYQDSRSFFPLVFATADQNAGREINKSQAFSISSILPT